MAQRGKPPRPAKVVQMALRLRLGRTMQNLMQLMACGLLRGERAGELVDIEAAPGLTAEGEGETVFILDGFHFRGVLRFDVVPVLAKCGPAGSTHTFSNAAVRTCRGADLSAVAFRHSVHRVRRGHAWLTERPQEER